jgi:hypothetical protein
MLYVVYEKGDDCGERAWFWVRWDEMEGRRWTDGWKRLCRLLRESSPIEWSI